MQDYNGCTGNSNLVTITPTTPVSATYSTTDATCNNTATGTATINATGGTSPYQYKNGSTGTYQTSNVITGLRPNTQYRMYVQDANGCTGYTSLLTVGQAAALTSVTTTTAPSCSSASNGTATINPTSGLPPYQYKYSSAGFYQSSNTFYGLAGGSTFRLYFQDATGCVGVGDQVTVDYAYNSCGSDERLTTGFRNAAIDNKTLHLEVSLSPNPGNNQFNVIAHTNNTQSVTIRVLDVNGRNLYQSKGTAEQPFRFGASFAPGTYLVEVRQGDEVKTVKAVKL